jgi:molybdopterin molybdotransferase
MISVSEARELIKNNCHTFGTEQVSLYQALGRFSAEDIAAPFDMPAFAQSAMDGYALRHEDVAKNIPFYNEGEIKAGDTLLSEVDPEHCIRIFTGALIPPGVDTVVMQERVEVSEKNIIVTDENLKLGANIRPKGSQSKQGDVILKKGDALNPAACGMLASFGIDKISVFKKPSIDILVTGDELKGAQENVKDGQIYESNSFALKAALNKLQLDDIRIRKAIDLEADTNQKIADGLKADVLIITGGISVGKYDLVQAALEKNGVEQVFHKVNQKPGKPLYFGKKGNTMVFGLPGNPGSVMNCFYIYVRHALAWAMGSSQLSQPLLQLKLQEDINKKNNKTFFIKGKIDRDKVEILDGQESYKMNAFAVADCLIEIPEDKQLMYKDELVAVHLI